MKKRNKPSLSKALKKVDSLPGSFFGNIEVDLRTLPCIAKTQKEKITANFDSDLLDIIRSTADDYGVPYTSLMNDVLREIFVKNKKTANSDGHDGGGE